MANDQTPVYARQRQPSPPQLSALWLLLSTGGFFLLGVLGVMLAYHVQYQEQVFGGVLCNGFDLSGVSASQAESLIQEKNVYPTQGVIGFRDGQRNWLVKPADIGLYLNAKETAVQAMRWGRRGGIIPSLNERFQAWYFGVDLPVLMLYNERAAHDYLSSLATQVNTKPVEAALHIQSLEVKVSPAQIGRTVNVPATLVKLRPLILNEQNGWVDLVVDETPPVVLDVEREADLVRKILSAPLTLTISQVLPADVIPSPIFPEELAQLLNIERVHSPDGDRYQVALQVEKMRPILEQLALKLNFPAEDGRFIFNDETRQLEVIQPAVIGRYLVVEKTLQQINQTLQQGDHKVELVFDRVNPRNLDDISAQDLQISELVGEYTSFFYGSDAGRVQNIVTAASRFHGLLVAPGETFSMASVMGNVSLDAGYAEAWIIYGDRTIKGVGGGVCQVSTTLFRNAFFSGFPVVERHPHAYRVSYYEYTAAGSINPNLAGLDATVFVPLVDFKFKNDLASWLLMETYVNPSAHTLTWKFYGASDGRTVEWQTSGLTQIVEPPEARYVENAELPDGKIKQVDWAVEGADVTVSRTVYLNGAVYLSDEYFTHYLPWADAYEYAPGTQLPDNPQEPQGYKKDE